MAPEPPPSPPAARRPLAAILLFLFGLATTALPILAFRYPATQDGGAHQNSAWLLAALETHASPFFDRLYTLRDVPPSNQLAARLMAWAYELGLGAVAQPLLWAIVFAAASAVIVANLAWLGRARLPFALLMFPIFAGTLANLGFANYLIGVVAFIQTIAVMQAGLHRPTLPWVAALTALAAATYLAHPLTGVALAFTVAGFGLAEMIRLRATSDPATSRPRARLVPLACILMGLAVTAFATYEAWPQVVRLAHLVTIGQPPATPTSPSVPGTTRDRLIALAEFGLLSYAPLDFVFVAAFLLLLAWLALRVLVHRRRTRAWLIEDGWLASMVALASVAALTPSAFEPFAPWRMIACLVAVTVLWLGSAPLGRAAAAVLVLAGLLFNASWCAYRLWWGAGIAAVLGEYASASQAIPEHATVLEVRASAGFQQRNCLAFRPRVLPCNFEPALHFAGQVVGQREVAELLNYQLRPEAGFFPVDLLPPWKEYLVFDEALSYWPPVGMGPPTGDVAQLVRRLPPDIILAWDERRATGAPQTLFPDALRPLVQDYDLVYQSQPLGLATVYRHRASP